MANLYAILFNCKGRPVPVDRLQPVINAAKDWARFEPHAWLIATNLNSSDWYERIRPALHTEDDILIVRVDLNDHSGWATNVIVEWLKRDHEGRPGV